MDYYRDIFQRFLQRPKATYKECQTKFELNISSFTFLDPRIYNEITTKMKKSVVRQFDWDGQHVRLIWVYQTGSLDRKRLDFLCNCVCLFISFFARPTSPKSLVLYLIDYPKPKRIGKDNSLIAYNVNSGLCTPMLVVIYRREEMVKVLMHELIHFYERDAKHQITPDQEQFFNNLFRIKCKSVIINECFTDTLACLVNVYLYSMLESRCEELTTLAYNIDKEKTFICQQAHKVLNLNGYFMENGILQRHSDICEQTNVTSYYILKALLFLNIDAFIEYLQTHDYSLSNINDFIDLLQTQCKDIHKLFSYSIKSKSLKFSSLDITKLRGKPKTI